MSEVKTIGPLSHSSATTLLGCEQKYVYYKVEGAKPDSDYEKSDALSIGSAVHQILEDSRHEIPQSLSAELLKCEKDPQIFLDRSYFNLVAAMVIKYCRMHKQMGLKVLAVEPEVNTDWFRGFLDVILEDENGKWWICDVKTWKSLGNSKVAEAPNDPQLNLYASFAPELSKLLGLELENFGGCRWRVVSKSSAKKKDSESDTAFVKRLADKNIKAFDLAVPIEIMDPTYRRKVHKELYTITKQLASGKRKPKKNMAHCMSYFSPCEYFSKCHGSIYSEAQNNELVKVSAF